MAGDGPRLVIRIWRRFDHLRLVEVTDDGRPPLLSSVDERSLPALIQRWVTRAVA